MESRRRSGAPSSVFATSRNNPQWAYAIHLKLSSCFLENELPRTKLSSTFQFQFYAQASSLSELLIQELQISFADKQTFSTNADSRFHKVEALAIESGKFMFKANARLSDFFLTIYVILFHSLNFSLQTKASYFCQNSCTRNYYVDCFVEVTHSKKILEQKITPN